MRSSRLGWTKSIRRHILMSAGAPPAGASKTMSSYAYHMGGRDFPKLGRVMTSPPAMSINGFYENSRGQKHGLDRSVNRDVTSADRLDAVKNPILVFEQGQGRRFAFLNARAMVVLTDAGELVTAYGASDFDTGIQNVLSDAGY